MGIAEFIIGPAEGRTRWLHPSYAPESFSSRAKWLRSLGTAKSMKARTFGTVSRPCGTITS
jgi:hypothetical protein